MTCMYAIMADPEMTFINWLSIRRTSDNNFYQERNEHQKSKKAAFLKCATVWQQILWEGYHKSPVVVVEIFL